MRAPFNLYNQSRTPVELLERCRAGMVIGHLAERFARYAVMLEDVLQKEGEK